MARGAKYGKNPPVLHGKRESKGFIGFALPGTGIETVKALNGSYPQDSGIVTNRKLGFGEVDTCDFCQFPRFFVVNQQALLFSSDPNMAFFVIGESPDQTISERRVLHQILFFEISLYGTAIIHPADIGPDPQALVCIDIDCERMIVRQRKTVLLIRRITMNRFVLRIINVYADIGRHPDSTLPIDEQILGREIGLRRRDEGADCPCCLIQKA